MAELRVTTDRDGSRSFGEHDDRWSRGGRGSAQYRGRGSYRSNNRRFQGGRKSYIRGGHSGRRGPSNSYRGRGGRSDVNPRSRVGEDEDGDEVMGGNEDQSNNRRFSPYGRPTKGGFRGGNNRYDGPNNSGGRPDALKRLGLPIHSKGGGGDSDWYKVIIPWGKKADKDFILQNINNHVDTPFLPTHFHFQDKTAVFYVQDRRAADSIRLVTKRITMPNGYKMTILVKNSGPPNIPMGEEDIEKLKVCMSNRYDPATKALNLSNFHSDSELQQLKQYMALARPQVMSNVVKVIQENIPELVSLDMSNNKLAYLEHLAGLVSKTPDLKSLNLGQNKLTHIEEMRKLGGWKLEGLKLDGNVLCDKFNDQTAYVSAVRKIFPKVIQLDGNNLPPPITFDIEARTDLPKSKDSFFPSSDSQIPVVKFLKDYFMVYDSDNRASLDGAYHDQALFSLSVAYNGAVQYKQLSLSAYLEESRNLVRTNNKDTNRKHKLLRHGSHIVPQICLLPKTMHDPNSFVVDISFVSPAFMSFTVQGVFKEVASKLDKPPIRAFSRTFVTVPGGSGMLILNDMLTVTNASPDQVQAAFKTPAPTPSSSPVPQTTPTNPFEGAALTDIQKKMIESFMTDSSMNAEWSVKCLAENGWEYAKAGQIFMQLQQEGKIPPEAFKK